MDGNDAGRGLGRECSWLRSSGRPADTCPNAFAAGSAARGGPALPCASPHARVPWERPAAGADAWAATCAAGGLAAAEGTEPAQGPVEAVFDIFRREFDMAYEEGGICQITCHPHFIGYRSRISSMNN